MKVKLSHIVLLLILCCAFPATALATSADASAILRTIHLGDHVIYKGEAKLVDIYHPAFTRAELSWQGKKIIFSSTPGEQTPKWEALLSLGLQSNAHTAPLTIRYFGNNNITETVSVNFAVNEKAYPVQKLSVAPKYVSPPESVLKKIKQDQKEIREAFGTISPTRHWTLPLLRPVDGVTTSAYGLRREFNGQKRNPHRGLDLSGQLGDSIRSIESGQVILVSDHYYGGKTVVVDHGLGVLSAYLHMDSFAVAQGEHVVRGQTIGTVGKSGRVTGPHLHLSISVLGQSINPEPLLIPRKTDAVEAAAK